MEHFWFPEAFRPRQDCRDAGIDIKKVIGQWLVAIQVAATKATRQWGQILPFDISQASTSKNSASLRSPPHLGPQAFHGLRHRRVVFGPYSPARKLATQRPHRARNLNRQAAKCQMSGCDPFGLNASWSRENRVENCENCAQ